MKIRSVAIVGAGAVGCYMLWGLSRKKDIDVCIVADGDRRERLERDGLVINGEFFRPVIRTPQQAHGADLVLVSVKYGALDGAVRDVAVIADEHTLVLSLLNGVDSEERFAAEIGEARIMPSLMKIASERVGNSVRFDPVTTIGVIYGERDADAPQERVQALNELFEGSGVHYTASDRIISEMWLKFRLNVVNNQPQAIVGCGVGAYKDSEHLAFIRHQLRDEVNAIAAAKGIDMTSKGNAKGSPVAPRARYSTLQDLDAKRHTEVDMFAGAVVRMGRELGIPTPYNEYTYHMIKALEEKNDGRFDYE